MPVAPCFDPSTGASGGATAGGGGGGDDLNALTWTTVDLADGSWTLTDPDSMVQSVSSAGGVNTVIMNELAAGSSNYRWDSGSAHRAPRWSKLAAPGGEQLVSDGTYWLMWRQRYVVPVSKFGGASVLGICTSPTSTVASTMGGFGAFMAWTTSSPFNTRLGAWTVVNAGIVQGSDYTTAVGTFMFTDRWASVAAYSVYDAGGVRKSKGTRTYAAQSLITATNMSLMVGLGTEGSTTTITDGQDAKFEAQYRIIKLAP
tara:strand:+ start:3276 stop:4049 length:774 start_codon:yes stop_codon:yes gene_type:complete